MVWSGTRSSVKRKDHTIIAKAVTTSAKKDLADTGLQVGSQIPPNNRAPLGALIAFPTEKDLHLYEYPVGDLQPTQKTRGLWHVSMGSGQMLCDPFLGFLRRIFWPKVQPTLSEGIFAVTWALQYAIDLNTGGIDGPIQIAILVPKTHDVPTKNAVRRAIRLGIMKRDCCTKGS